MSFLVICSDYFVWFDVDDFNHVAVSFSPMPFALTKC